MEESTWTSGFSNIKLTLISAVVFTFLVSAYWIRGAGYPGAYHMVPGASKEVQPLYQPANAVQTNITGQPVLQINNQTTASVQPPNNIVNTSGLKKVLLMPYMRGGSSLLGQIFNAYPKSVYWYEPLDPFYSSFVGTSLWSIPLDLTEGPNGDIRVLSEEEQTELTDAVISILSCNASQMLAPIFAHDGGAMAKGSGWSKDFMACRKKLKPSTTASCANSLKKFCPRNTAGALSKGCHKGIKAAIQGVPEDDPVWKNDTSRFNAFKSFNDCMQKLAKNMQSCASIYDSVCHNAVMTSTKILRMRMELVDRVLAKDPSIHVVQFIRDPRGIMLSRKKIGLLATVTKRSMEKEGAVLCRQMSQDIEVNHILQKKYPNNILMMRYEDLVTNVEFNIRKLFTFIGVPYSPKVLTTINKLMFSNVKKEAGFSQQRKNGTQNAMSWKSKIKPSFKSYMDKTCHDILLKFNYTV